MKKLHLIITAFLIFCSVNGYSQESTAGQKAEELTKTMKSQINFSDDKYEKVEAINLDFFGKTEKLKATDSNKLEKLKQLKKLDEERDTQLKEVFSSEEYKLFKENKSKNRKAFKSKFKESQN